MAKTTLEDIYKAAGNRFSPNEVDTIISELKMSRREALDYFSNFEKSLEGHIGAYMTLGELKSQPKPNSQEEPMPPRQSTVEWMGHGNDKGTNRYALVRGRSAENAVIRKENRRELK
jgi:hypothetical protein